jgi:hypothetical protein
MVEVDRVEGGFPEPAPGGLRAALEAGAAGGAGAHQARVALDREAGDVSSSWAASSTPSRKPAWTNRALARSPWSITTPSSAAPSRSRSRRKTAPPKGLTLSDATGVISGVPTESGDFSVTVTAKNANGPADETVFLTIHVAPLAAGVVGTFHGFIERSS